jgi:hypothetical protein
MGGKGQNYAVSETMGATLRYDVNCENTALAEAWIAARQDRISIGASR